jgi:hypothetical protein
VKKPYASATPAPNANCEAGFDGDVPGSVTM